MSNQQAKFVLHSFRGEADAADVQFAEALQQAGNDPKLAEWLAEEQAWDSAIRRKLREVPAPEDLRETLLSSGGAFPVRAHRPRAALLALAAAIVLFAIIAAMWQRAPESPASFAAYRSQMIGTISYGVRLEFQNTDLAQLQQWLGANTSFSNVTVPAGLQNKPGLGCRKLLWQGQPVGLICFQVGPNEAVHLFVTSRVALDQLPASVQPQFRQHGDWMTASWARGDTVYLATMRTKDQAYLEQFL